MLHGPRPWLHALVSCLVLNCAAPAQSACHRLTRREAERLIALAPEAQHATRLGATLSFFDWRIMPADPDKLARMVMGRGGDFHAPLDNGLIGYYTVDLRTAIVRDVNGDLVTDAVLDQRRKRILATAPRRSCRPTAEQ